ncbi:hypothetical protein Tco_0523074 [Tanacetum coccineum]
MKSFNPKSFIYWKNIFKTYVKSKDLDLWHVITNGDFQPIQQNPETKLAEVIPFEKQSNDRKKRLTKNNEAKMVIYNALPRNEYERIFMCNTAKEIWKTLLITHQGNNQVNDNKINLLVQQYEQFVISEDESIDSAFARFNTIITSLKALDEGYSIKNYDKKFLRARHLKWREKVTAIEESKDLTSLSFDELIGNLKVHKMIIKKDSEIVKVKVERKTLALKAMKESSDEECSTFKSEDEEYVMAVRDFKKFFKRREFPKPPKDKNQRAFVEGSWSDSGEEDDEKVNNKTCLVAQASSEIITKNKRLKATRNNLEKELSVLKKKVSTLKKNKGVDLECVKCHMLKIENEKLKEEATRLNKFEKSTHCLNEMLSNQKPSGEKLGLGFNSFEASSNGTKEIKFVKARQKASSDVGPINMGGPQSVQATPKTIMGPPPVGTPGSEKMVKEIVSRLLEEEDVSHFGKERSWNGGLSKTLMKKMSRMKKVMEVVRCDAKRVVPVNETFHEQTDDELTEKELKQVEVDDQAIQTILLGLPEDIYTAVDSCETAQEIWLRVQQMMKGSYVGIQKKKAKLFNEWERFTSTDGESIESYYHRFSKVMNDFKRNKNFPKKIASNLKFLNNLQPEWSRHVTIVHQTKDLHTADYTQLYDLLKYNQKEVDDLRAERLAKIHDPLALMANSNNPFNYPVFHQDQPSPCTDMQQLQPNNNNYNPQPSFNQNYMQQLMPNPEYITDPTTAMNMTLVLMAKAFKLNYLTPTNNN